MRVPRPLFLRAGFWCAMPKGLKRHYGQGQLHLVTFSCYRRRPLLVRVPARSSKNGKSYCRARLALVQPEPEGS
jgi:hypothetical protein